MNTSALAQKSLDILNSTTALGAAGTVNSLSRAKGFTRIRGVYYVFAGGVGPAAGFPRVVFSSDGGITTIVRQVFQDFSQPPGPMVFPFDLPIEEKYVGVEYTNGAGASTVIAYAQLLPEA